MVALSQILDLPLDDGEAFVAYEEHARRQLKDHIANADREDRWAPFWLEYMTNVREAAIEFGVVELKKYSIIPPIGPDD